MGTILRLWLVVIDFPDGGERKIGLFLGLLAVLMIAAGGFMATMGRRPERQGRSASSAVIVCLGEGLVDLICERPVDSLAEADSFAPHFGGALANVAVARAGPVPTPASRRDGRRRVGSWLAARLEREGVDLRFFELLAASRRRSPSPCSTTGAILSFRDLRRRGRRRGAVGGPAGGRGDRRGHRLVYSSTTLAVRRPSATWTWRARERRSSAGARVCFDPNIRPNRWGGDPGPAVEASRELVPDRSWFGRTAMRRWRSPGSTTRAAADELAAMGAELAAVTLAEEGAVIRGACEAEAPAAQVAIVSTWAPATRSWARWWPIALRDWDAARAGEALAPALDAAGRRARAGAPSTDQPATVAASASASRSASSGVLCRWGEMRSELPRTAAKQPASASAAGAAARPPPGADAQHVRGAPLGRERLEPHRAKALGERGVQVGERGGDPRRLPFQELLESSDRHRHQLEARSLAHIEAPRPGLIVVAVVDQPGETEPATQDPVLLQRPALAVLGGHIQIRERERSEQPR